MNPEHTIHAAQYFTATIYEWQAVLADDSHKDIIIDSLQYLVNDKRIELNAFVPIAIGMSSRIHLIWQALTGFPPHWHKRYYLQLSGQAGAYKYYGQRNHPDNVRCRRQ